MEWLNALGGVAVLVAVILMIIVFLFKKQLNPFFENMTELRYKELEIISEQSKGLNRDVSTREIENTNEVEEVQEKEVEKEEVIKEDDIHKDMLYNLFEAWKDKDKEKMEQYFNKMQQEVETNYQKMVNEAIYYEMLYQMGEDVIDKFDEIERKSKGTEAYGMVMNFIARAYNSTDNFSLAENYLQKGLKEATPSDKPTLLKGLASTYHKLGKIEEAYSLIISSINSADSSSEKFEYFTKLAELYKEDNKIDFQIYALESALEIKPNDKDLLFNIAYAYSDNDQDLLAVFYYKKLVGIDPTHRTALNNLGVAYSKNGLEFLSIENYRKSFELGNTLAASNLAYAYMKAGFEEEARATLMKANEHDNVHENVGEAKVSLNSKVANEKDEDIKKAALANKEKLFQQSLATAKFRETTFLQENVQGEWILDKKHEANIQMESNKLIINWTKNSRKYKFVADIENSHVTSTYYEMEYELPYSAKNEKEFVKKGTALGYFENEKKLHIRRKVNDSMLYYTFIKQIEE